MHVTACKYVYSFGSSCMPVCLLYHNQVTGAPLPLMSFLPMRSILLVSPLFWVSLHTCVATLSEEQLSSSTHAFFFPCQSTLSVLIAGMLVYSCKSSSFRSVTRVPMASLLMYFVSSCQSNSCGSNCMLMCLHFQEQVEEQTSADVTSY